MLPIIVSLGHIGLLKVCSQITTLLLKSMPVERDFEAYLNLYLILIWKWNHRKITHFLYYFKSIIKNKTLHFKINIVSVVILNCEVTVNYALSPQINLQRKMRVTGVITQGAKRIGSPEYIKSYKIAYSNDGKTWAMYKVKGTSEDMVRLT